MTEKEIRSQINSQLSCAKIAMQLRHQMGDIVWSIEVKIDFLIWSQFGSHIIKTNNKQGDLK